MSTRLIIIAAGIGIILAAFYFYGEYTGRREYNRAVDTLSQDSTITQVDTVWVKADTVISYEWLIIREAIIDTVDNILTYSTQMDTTITVNKDTVAVISQDISLTEGIFDILMNIEIRPIEKIINVLTTEFRTVVREVAMPPPFYNTTVFGVILILVLEIFVAVAIAIASI